MTPTLNIEAAVKMIMVHGPSRVMIDPDEAVPPARAREQYGIIPDVIFIRDDGWSLGAPKGLEGAAFKQWSDSWVAFLRRPATTAKPITDYTESLSRSGELRRSLTTRAAHPRLTEPK